MPNYAWRKALRTRAFWLLVVGGAVFSLSSGVSIFNAFMMRQLGYESAISGGASLIDGASAILFVLVGGWLGDHFPIRRTLFVFGLLAACAAGVLAFAETLPMFYLSAALAGMGTGGMVPLTLAARGVYFGRRNFATITGLSLMLPNLVSGGALAGILIGWLSEITGAYTLPLAIIAVIDAVGSLAFLFLGDPKLAPSQGERSDGITSVRQPSGDFRNSVGVIQSPSPNGHRVSS